MASTREKSTSRKETNIDPCSQYLDPLHNILQEAYVEARLEEKIIPTANLIRLERGKRKYDALMEEIESKGRELQRRLNRFFTVTKRRRRVFDNEPSHVINIFKEKLNTLKTLVHDKFASESAQSPPATNSPRVAIPTKFTATLPDTSPRKKRGTLPKEAVQVLKDWLFKHFNHPYPTEEEKAQLAALTGLQTAQVNYWFINARVRIWRPMLENGK